jgi:F-type H+-transporting ATPase subunit b
MNIVHQLGELFLQAVPTVLIILVFFLVLRSIFFAPLLKVMAEREARTTGAQKEALTAQASATEGSKRYEEALKQARARLYADQEAARKKLFDDRAAKLKEARSKGAAEVAAAKDRIARDLAVARRDVDASVAKLAAEIARRLLQAPRPHGPTRGVR